MATVQHSSKAGTQKGHPPFTFPERRIYSQVNRRDQLAEQLKWRIQVSSIGVSTVDCGNFSAMGALDSHLT
jgi:hypothetical protein